MNIEKDSALYKKLLEIAEYGEYVEEIEHGRIKHDMNSIEWILEFDGKFYSVNLTSSYNHGILELNEPQYHGEPEFVEVKKVEVKKTVWKVV